MGTNVKKVIMKSFRIVIAAKWKEMWFKRKDSTLFQTNSQKLLFLQNNDTILNNNTFVGKQSKMSIWYKIQTLIGVPDRIGSESTKVCLMKRNASLYAFVDVEVDMRDKKVHDIGALRHDGAVYHGGSKKELLKFLDGIDFLCGHNIIWHDASQETAIYPHQQLSFRQNSSRQAYCRPTAIWHAKRGRFANEP